MDRTRSPRATAGRITMAALLALLSLPALARHPVVEAARSAVFNADAEAAVAAGEKAAGVVPKDAEAWYYAGQAYGRMAIEASMLRKASWANKARDAFRKAATLDPDHLGAREGLVQYYTLVPAIMGGGEDKATAEIADYARRNPAGGHYLRALTLKGDAAERELRTAVRMAPGEVVFRSALVNVLDRAKRPADALAALEAALQRTPDHARLLYSLGRHAALHDVRLEAGKAALDRIIGKTAVAFDEVPKAGAHWRRGQLLEKLGQQAAALADYRKALVLDPGLDEARAEIARLTAGGK